MTELTKSPRNNILINENGVISLNHDDNEYLDEIPNDSFDESDLSNNYKLLINSSNDLKLEIKYPNIEKIQNLNSRKYLKHIHFKVKPTKKPNSDQTSLCESILGIYPNLAFDCNSNDYKVIIQGFLPKKFTFKHSDQLKIGDMIISINDIPVNSSNIESMLSAIKRPQTIKITALMPLTYINLNTTDLITTPFISGNVDPNNMKTRQTCGRVVANSKSTQVLQGDRVKCSSENLIEEFSYFVMILTLDKEVVQQENSMDDLVYRFPNNGGEVNRQNIGMNDLILLIRGMFMTLSLSIKDVNHNDDQAICCLIEHQDQLFNVCFLKQNFSKSAVLILVVPNEHIGLTYLKVLAKNLNNTIQFTFGNLFTKSSQVLKKTLQDCKKTKLELDTFFAQLKGRLSNKLNQNMQRRLQDKSMSLRRTNYLLEIRSKFINSMPYLDLPFEMKCDLDATLSDIEAQEFVDLENTYYKNRRQFTIMGSCLFYKDNLISTHLAHDVTKNIHDYCEHYGLFNLVKNGNTDHFHIWREISIEGAYKASRCFLIISGLKEFLYGMILESGGVIPRQISANQLIEPDPFFIQQSTFILTDLHDNGIMSEISTLFKGNKNIVPFDINQFVKIKKKSASTKTRSRSKSRSPMRLSNIFNFQNSKKSDDKRNQSNQNQAESKVLYMNDNIYHFHKEQRHISPSPNPGNTNQTNMDMQCQPASNLFNDISLNSSIIYYAQSDCLQNGIFFPQRQYDYNSNLFARVFANFVQSCFKIKDLFESSYSFDTTNSDNSLSEQGVLFNIIIDDQKGEQQSSSKVKEMTFWVVGRRKMKRMAPKSNWTHVGDFFVCFNDSVDQVLLELAFDMGFAKLAI